MQGWGGVGDAGVGWVMQGEVNHVGVGWVIQGWGGVGWWQGELQVFGKRTVYK